MTTPSFAGHRTRPGEWIPILEGDSAVIARTAIEEITQGLVECDPDEPGLANGAAGIALFFAYLEKATERGAWLDVLQRLLMRATNGQIEPKMYASFIDGAAGIAWVIAHVKRMSLVDRAYDVDAHVKKAILAAVSERPWPGVHDHSHGLAGCGLYALECEDRAYGNAVLEQVIDRLAETAIRQADGVTWWTPPHTLPESFRKDYPQGGFNLGLAHGIPSIAAFLAQACDNPLVADRARRLLDRAMSWLLARRNVADGRSRYNAFLPLLSQHEAAEPLTVRWCYGDLGVSAAMYWVAITVNEPSWAREAIELAREVARRPIRGVGVRDPLICHGAAGNAHIFNRLYQATREEVFLSAARRWLNHTLSFYRPGNGVGGFRTLIRGTRDTEDEWTDEPGVFGGAAGIGLALLGAIGVTEPAWDKIMMVSIPPSSPSPSSA